MKKFNIKVNGNSYEVEIEEVKSGVVAPKAAPKAAPAPAAPKAAPAAAAAKTVSVGAGDTAVKAPMPGKIIKLVAAEGQAVKKGDVLLILEAMKMQNEISAPVDGKVKGFSVAAGQNVKPGEDLVVIG